MALFARKENPIEAELQYASRIDAVGYPFFRRSAPGGKMTFGEPEEYSYLLEVGVKSYYRAEGHLHCPGLDNALAFMFQTENLVGSDHHLALGEGPLQISGPPTMIPSYYLDQKDIGEPGRREEIANALKTAIQREFLHQDGAWPFQRTEYVRSLLVSVGQAARVEYQRNLEQQLRENPRAPVFPQQYRYDIDGKVFDATKLVKA